MRSFKYALTLFGLAAGLFASLLGLPLPSSGQIAHTLPLAPILTTKIFVQGDKPSKFEYVGFNAPVAGKALLRVVNAAKVGATKREQMQGVEITLNGKTVVSGRKAFERQTSVLELWVSLKKGTNGLGVKLPSKQPKEAGKRLSARIDAPADKIVLTPVLSPIVVGRDPLRAQATVTGLSMPVPDAEVIFEIRGLGADIEQRAVTGDAGIATAYIRGFNEGNGMLRAKVTARVVSETPIKAVVAPSIILEKSPEYMKLESGAERVLPLTVNVLTVNPPGNRVMLQHVIEPDSDGLAISREFPVGGYQVDAPQAIQVNPTVTANIPGSYTVTTIATITETGDLDSHELSVEVVEPDTPDRLILFNPSADPSGIPSGPASTTVTFRAVVGGTLTPPAFLYLDEVDAEGTLLFENVVELQRDNENDIYTGTLAIPSKVAAEKYFRVRAWDFDKFVTSGISTVGITSFPLDSRPPDPETLVTDPENDSRLFSNEVIIRVHPGVSSDPDRINDIAKEVGGTVVGVIPSVRKYLLEIREDGTVSSVQTAIETLLTFEEVEEAYPNYEVVEEAIPTEAPSGCTSDTGNCQWYIEHVGIKKAWDKAGGGSSAIPVVVVESSGLNALHPDLEGQCQDGVGTNPCAATNDQHGTWVAGVIGAKANNGGIAGVAWDTQLDSYKYESSSYNLASVISAVTSGKKIINMSLTNQGGLEKEVRDAINKGFLIVAAAGNVGSACQAIDKYPAAYNKENGMGKGILAVGATDINNGLAKWGVVSSSQCSNSSDWIDIFAPGKNIYTTDSKNSSNYSSQSGTSLATPIVSGAAALLWALNPHWTAEMVHDKLVDRATVLSSTDGTTSDSRLNGRRLINVFAALGAPSDLTLEPPSPSVPENSAAGIKVATVSAVDVDVTDPSPGAPAEKYSYSLEVIDDAGNPISGCNPFQIDSSTDNMVTISTVGDGCPLDYETTDSYNIKVSVVDSVGLSFDKNFTINVTNVDDVRPTISSIGNQTIFVDTVTGTLPFTVADEDTAATSLTVSAGSSNTTLVPNADANIDLGGSGDSRNVTITPAAGQTGTTTITLTVIDDGGNSTNTSFSVTVTSPTSINNNYRVENQSAGSSNPWLPDGDWVIGARESQRVLALNFNSSNGGQTLNGTMRYAGEGLIGFRATLTQNNTYTVENQWGGPSAPWNPGGDWVLGARADQNVLAINIASTDGGETFTGDVTYAGEGTSFFRGTLINVSNPP